MRGNAFENVHLQNGHHFVQASICQIKNTGDIDGLVQERRNSSALAMELRLSCTNPSISSVILSTWSEVWRDIGYFLSLNFCKVIFPCSGSSSVRCPSINVRRALMIVQKSPWNCMRMTGPSLPKKVSDLHKKEIYCFVYFYFYFFFGGGGLCFVLFSAICFSNFANGLHFVGGGGLLAHSTMEKEL